MSGPDQEIELKFACEPEDLAAVLAATPAGDDESRELISVYFDTADRVLERAGVSLRVREHKARRVQTVKRGRGLVREEYEAPIAGLAPDITLEPLPKLLPKDATLRPAFNVRVNRRQRTLRYAGAKIEVALDEGEASSGERRRRICEVELELKSGPSAALFGLARELAAAAPLYLAFESKAAQGRTLLAGGPPDAYRSDPIVLARDASAAQAFHVVATGALAQIAANAARLRVQPGAEAVHQLRVGVRRFRSALSTFKPIVQGDGLDTLKADLKWLSASCDRARNLDVFATETLQPVSGIDREPLGGESLRTAIDLARRAAWTHAAEAVASDRFRTLMIDAVAWLETGDWRSGPEAQARALGFARRALKRHRKRLAQRGDAARGGGDDARHHLRIEAKKLRYASEDFESLFAEKAVHRYLERLKAMQDVLGGLNDLVTAEPLITALALPPDAASTASALVGRKGAAKSALIAQAMEALEALEAADPFWD